MDGIDTTRQADKEMETNYTQGKKKEKEKSMNMEMISFGRWV